MTKSVVFGRPCLRWGIGGVACGVNVFVQDGVIREISERPAGVEDEVVDCGGRVLMPGLIDAHVHVYAAGLNIVRVAQSPMSYLAHFAAQFMRSSLDADLRRCVMSAARTLAWCWPSKMVCWTVFRDCFMVAGHLADRWAWRLSSGGPFA